MNIFQEVFASVSKSNNKKAQTCKGIENTFNGNKAQDAKYKSMPRSKSPIKSVSRKYDKNEESFLSLAKGRRSKTPTVQPAKVERPKRPEPVDPKSQIDKKNKELHQIELQIMNAKSEIANLRKSLESEKIHTEKLKEENNKLSIQKLAIEKQNKSEEPEIEAVIKEQKDILRKRQEFLEYWYYEIVTKLDNYKEYI